MRAVRPEVTSRLVDKCEAATGWKYSATRRSFRMMIPRCAHTSGARGRRSKLELPHRYGFGVLSQHFRTADSRQDRRPCGRNLVSRNVGPSRHFVKDDRNAHQGVALLRI